MIWFFFALLCIVVLLVGIVLIARVKQFESGLSERVGTHWAVARQECCRRVSDLWGAITQIKKHAIFNACVTVKQGKLQRSTADAACWDIYSTETVTIWPDQQVMVASGLITAMYECDALMFDRSGLSAKFMVSRRAGVIDATFPEEWKVILINEGREPYLVKAGDRVAQTMFVPKFKVPVVSDGGEVVSLDTIRQSGLGSTGA